MTTEVLPGSCSGVCVKRLGYIGAWHKRRYTGFTLIELVVVFGLILILTGLVLSTVGYARKKGARARAETEIAAMSAACESYKADNAVYPRGNGANPSATPPSDTDNLDAKMHGDPGADNYAAASLLLYKVLSGDTNANRSVNAADVSQTKSRLGQTVDATNFRSDVNANGSINSGDIAIVKQNSGTSLPPQ